MMNLSPWITLLRRILFYAVSAWVLFFAMVVVALRWWILPEINQHRPEIESRISKVLGQRVSIARIESDWAGLRPHLKLEQVVVHDRQGAPALHFDRIDTTLSWYSLLHAELRLHRLEVTRPRFEFRREPNGLIYLNGVVGALNDPNGPHDFGDWLLRQENIQINHAIVEWRDIQRSPEPLQFSDVGVRLVNQGKHHRFGFVAIAPRELASTFDVRGDFRGSTLAKLQDWQGNLYVDLGATDIAAWRTWIELPYRVRQGTGATRLWANFKQGRPVSLAALVRLQQVRAQLGKKLPELDLVSLSGHLRWEELAQGFRFESKHLAFDAGTGRRFATKNLTASYQAAAGKNPEQGEFQAEDFDVAPLLALAGYLPLSEVQRNQLHAASPKGVFKKISLQWQGAPEAPVTYKIKGDFTNLGIQALGRLPGFSNLSGVVEADPHGGLLRLTGKNAQLDMPLVFRQPLSFDALNAAANWSIKDRKLGLTIAQLEFANANIQGNVSGGYALLADGKATLDLEGRVARAQATTAHLYVPRILSDGTHAWLKSALIAGNAEDVRVKIKGPVDRFPFPNDKDGVFQVTGKVKQGILQYAEGWPRIENVQGLMDFHGIRMDIREAQGTIYQTRIQRTKISIPDLEVFDEILEVDGETQGATMDQLRFIEESPLGRSLESFTGQMRAEGAGKLTLSMRMPIRRADETRFSGSYQFQNNKLWLTLNAPALEQASGKLELTEKGIAVPKITGQLLGGPITLSSRTTPDGVTRIGAVGRVSAEGLQKGFPGPYTKRLKGTTGWSASVAVRKRAVNVVLTSNLNGLESSLPYPLDKASAETLPLKIERRYLDAEHDVFDLSLGNDLSAQLLRDTSGVEAVITKGKIVLGKGEAKAVESGVWIDGALESFDLDVWRNLIFASEDEPPLLTLAGIKLQMQSLDFLGRRFNNFRINAIANQDTWQAAVTSDEMQGNINWRDREGGRMVANFKRLVYPDAAPSRGVKPAGGHDLDLPALDIVIDEFQLKKAKLGKIELLANKKDKDWRIERLRISNADGTLNASGVWQSWLEQPQSKLDIELEVKDVGGFLTRMGYPERMRGGNAKLDGKLNWRGSPQDFNLATLSGDLKLEARKGQFMKVDPGVGKLLGLLSLQSLPRRLTLDFRDVFSDGFAFDSILGVMTINQGVVNTNDFVMQGPAAVVSMTGTTDLSRETQNLKIKVVPVVGDSVSLLAFLGGPVAGIGTFVLQKLFKDPLGQIVSYDYSVTGTWENPVAVKLDGKNKEGAS